MSTSIHEHMTGGREHRRLSNRLTEWAGTFGVWWRRHLERYELAQWPEHDLNDIGRSRSDVTFEVEKPFWRA
mgnify:CR=1 FL=1